MFEGFLFARQESGCVHVSREMVEWWESERVVLGATKVYVVEEAGRSETLRNAAPSHGCLRRSATEIRCIRRSDTGAIPGHLADHLQCVNGYRLGSRPITYRTWLACVCLTQHCQATFRFWRNIQAGLCGCQQGRGGRHRGCSTSPTKLK